MRIGVNALYLIPGGVGGTEIYLRSLLTALAETDRANEYFVFTNRETGADVAPKASNFRVVPQAVRARSRPGRILWEQTALPLTVARLRIDVLWNPGFTAPLACPCPQVTTFHDLQHKRHPEYFRWWDLPFWRFFLFWSAQVSRRIVAVSGTTAKDLRRFYRLPEEKIRVVPSGVDPVFFEVAGRRRPERFLLAVSTLHPHKNLEGLLRAFARFRREHPEFRLVVCGMHGFATGMAHELRDRLGLTGAVDFPGGFRGRRYMTCSRGPGRSCIRRSSKASDCRCWRGWRRVCRRRARRSSRWRASRATRRYNSNRRTRRRSPRRCGGWWRTRRCGRGWRRRVHSGRRSSAGGRRRKRCCGCSRRLDADRCDGAAAGGSRRHLAALSAAPKIGNDRVSADFGERGLTSLRDGAIGAYRFTADHFSITIDGKRYDSATLPQPKRTEDDRRVDFVYQAGGFTITAVYETRPGWRFVSKQIDVESKVPAKFKVDEVVLFQSALGETPKDVYTIARAKANLGTGDYGACLRFGSRGLLVTAQNPFLAFTAKEREFTLGYKPEMEWDPKRGAVPVGSRAAGAVRADGRHHARRRCGPNGSSSRWTRSLAWTLRRSTPSRSWFGHSCCTSRRTR